MNTFSLTSESLMPLLDSLIGPLASIIDKVIPDKAARDIAAGMNAYLAGLPEPLYALFGTGYLGYTAARQWGKIKGVER